MSFDDGLDGGLTVRLPDEPPDPGERWGERLWRWAMFTTITVVGVTGLWWGLGWMRAPNLPRVAPALVLRSLAGETVDLASFRGQRVLLNFWATWCGPCQMEMPMLVDYSRHHPGSTLLFVAMDGEPVALRAYAASVGQDPTRVLRMDAATAALWSVHTLPTTVLVSATGEIETAHAGLLVLPQLWWMMR